MQGLATTISLLTSVSLAAIATNRKVKGGGDYYVISRTLGVEFGGALGLILYAAQAISVAFYCVGFGEGVGALVGEGELVATGAAARGRPVSLRRRVSGRRPGHPVPVRDHGHPGKPRSRPSSPGRAGTWSLQTLDAGWRPAGDGTGFWIVFAIFFPAVTGFTQGVSMSGDLKDPARSLPSGTFLAVGVSTVVYVAAMFALAGSLPARDLVDDYDSLRRIAMVPSLIDAGVLSATLSSALASFLGAPRILQALARDRLFPALAPFARGDGPGGNPRRGVLLTGGIALVTIALGDLNRIAALVSMSFLVSYGLLNYATYVEAVGASPSFRPRFRFFHARASLAGTGLCGLVMLMIDPLASAAALGLLGGLYHYLRWTGDAGDMAGQPPRLPLQAGQGRPARSGRWSRVGHRLAAARPRVHRDPGAAPATPSHGELDHRRLRHAHRGPAHRGRRRVASDTGATPGGRGVAQGRGRRAPGSAPTRWWWRLRICGSRPRRFSNPGAWGRSGRTRCSLNWYDGYAPGAGPVFSLWYARLLQRAARLDQHVVVLHGDDRDWPTLVALAARDPPHRRLVDGWRLIATRPPVRLSHDPDGRVGRSVGPPRGPVRGRCPSEDREQPGAPAGKRCASTPPWRS